MRFIKYLSCSSQSPARSLMLAAFLLPSGLLFAQAAPADQPDIRRQINDLKQQMLELEKLSRSSKKAMVTETFAGTLAYSMKPKTHHLMKNAEGLHNLISPRDDNEAARARLYTATDQDQNFIISKGEAKKVVKKLSRQIQRVGQMESLYRIHRARIRYRY
ncbi:MAG: hypothetical protein ACE5HD_00950 [Acidobacteriota bacterium]